jgi:hypothetical protein
MARNHYQTSEARDDRGTALAGQRDAYTELRGTTAALRQRTSGDSTKEPLLPHGDPHAAFFRASRDRAHVEHTLEL